ncbi:MAG: TIGR03557 family F420-dependent LLM class oxidoreductase [Chloroflexia bacterium]
MDPQPTSLTALTVESGPTIGYVLSDEQFPITRLVELGAAAERAGFDAVWSSDHFQPWQDNQGHSALAWLTLAAVGQRTQRVVMGTGVTVPTYRYPPAIVAQGFATLGLLYPGRIFLGVGTGEAINEEAATGRWDPYPVRAERLVEAILVIRKLWTGDMINHQGRYYTLKTAKLYDLPPVPVPIYVAAGGKKSLRLAGEHGDGLICDTDSAMKPDLRAAFEEGARAAGKDPATMPIVAEAWAIVGNEDEARKYAPLWRFSPDASKDFTNNPDPRDIQRQAERDIPLEKVYEKWVVSPDPKAHIEAIQKYIAAGITTIFLHSPQEDQQAVIDFFSKRVLPEVKGK